MTDLPRLAFLHIPKTAGTSLRQYLSSFYGPLAFHGMTTLDYRHYSAEGLSGYRFFSGHLYRRDLLKLPGDTIHLTILRNPVDRAISLYRYYREIEDIPDDSFIGEAIRTAKSGDISDFLYSNNPFLIEHLRAGQLRQFLSEGLLEDIDHRRSLTDELEQRLWMDFMQNIEQFEFVFTVDLLDLAVPCLMKRLRLGDAMPTLERLNQSRPGDHIDEMRVRRAVYDISALDCRAYDYAVQRQHRFLRRELFNAL